MCQEWTYDRLFFLAQASITSFLHYCFEFMFFALFANGRPERGNASSTSWNIYMRVVLNFLESIRIEQIHMSVETHTMHYAYVLKKKKKRLFRFFRFNYNVWSALPDISVEKYQSRVFWPKDELIRKGPRPP